MIDNIPTSKISSLAIGLAEISGAAEYGDSVLKSPKAEADCVFYSYKNTNKRAGIEKVCSTSTFYVQDDTGLILVDPKNAELELGNPNYEDEEKIEWLIEAGEPIYILGTVKENKHLLQESRKKLIKKLVELKNDPEAMAHLDTNKDGIITNEEWDEAANGIKEQLAMAESNQAIKSPMFKLIIGKGEIDTIFIISKKTEKELCRILSSKTLFRVIGGSVFALVSAAYIIYGTMETILISMVAFIILLIFLLFISKGDIDVYDI